MPQYSFPSDQYDDNEPDAAAPAVAIQAPQQAVYDPRVGSPEPIIKAAVAQLNAGQPVTALPRQTWSFPEQQAFNARLDAFDQQAKAARVAAEQAARDAQMLAQMSRVAKSTKDIELAMQQQDVIGFRNAVATGTPAFQALQRFPRAATAPLVSGLRATQTHAPMSDVATPIKTPEGEVLGYGTETGPTTRHIMPKAKPISTMPTPAQEISALRARAALKEQQYIVSNPKKGSPEEKEFLDALKTIDKRLEELGAGSTVVSPIVPATNAPPIRNAVRNPKTGKWELK